MARRLSSTESLDGRGTAARTWFSDDDMATGGLEETDAASAPEVDRAASVTGRLRPMPSSASVVHALTAPADVDDNDGATSNDGDVGSDDSIASNEGAPSLCSSLGVDCICEDALEGSRPARCSTRPLPLLPPSLITLPEELLVSILQRLSVPDQASMAATCRRLAFLLEDTLSFPRLQEAKLLRRFLDTDHNDDGQLLALSRLACTAERAQLPWIHVRPSVSAALQVLGQSPRLTSLNANHCREITTDVLPQISRLRHIRELDLSCNKSITNEDVVFLLSSLRSLESLSLRKCVTLSDSALLGLHITARKLKFLDLRACPLITGSFLMIDSRPRRRAPVDSSGTDERDQAAQPTDAVVLTLESLRLMRLLETAIALMVQSAPRLRELTAQDARHVTDHGCELLAQLTSLECLKLRCCMRISPVGMAALAAGLPRLETLGLRGKRGCHLPSLTTLTDLKTLRLSWKADMFDEQLVYLTQHFPKLVKLDLSNCAHLTDRGVIMALTELRLVSFKLVGCEKVTDQGYYAILRCPTLEKLTVDWSTPRADATPALSEAQANPATAGSVSSSTTHGRSTTVPTAPASGTSPPNSVESAHGISALTMYLFRRPFERIGNSIASRSSASAASTGLASGTLSRRRDSTNGHEAPQTSSALSLSAEEPALASADGLASMMGDLQLVRGDPRGPTGDHDDRAEQVATASQRGSAPAHGSRRRPPPPLHLGFLIGLRHPFGQRLRSLRLCHRGPADNIPVSAAIASIATLRTVEDLRLCAWPLQDSHAEVLAAGLPQLRTLILTKTHLTGRGIYALGDGLRQLVHLDLRHGSEITGEGLASFRRINAPLHTLVLAACPKLEAGALRTIALIHNLHWLDLSMTLIRSADLCELTRSMTLRKLIVRGCPNLSAAASLKALQHAKHLHTIDLSGCPLQEPAGNRASAAGSGSGINLGSALSAGSNSTSASVARTFGLRLPTPWSTGSGGRSRTGTDADEPVYEPMTPTRWESLRRPFAKLVLQTNADDPAVSVDVYV